MIKRIWKESRQQKYCEAVGCDKCNNTGYKGRIAIVEAILSTKEMEKVIMANSSDREIKEAARISEYS